MKNQIENAITILKRGGLILYPTDTVWGIGCDATNPEAVKKVFKLKNRNDKKSLICLVSDFKMLNEYVEDVPEVAYDILKYVEKPDRKSTRLNSSHVRISYAVFCLKKKKQEDEAL